jgi:hypothetical protein
MSPEFGSVALYTGLAKVLFFSSQKENVNLDIGEIFT